MQISIGPAHLNMNNQVNNNNSNSSSLNNIASVNVNLTNNQQTVSLTSLANSNSSTNGNNNVSQSNGIMSTSANLVNANLLSTSARVEQIATQAAAQAAANVALRHIMHSQIYHPQHQSHHLNPIVSGLFQNNNSNNSNNTNNNMNSNLAQIHAHYNSNAPNTIQAPIPNAYRSHLSGQSPLIHFPSMVPYMQRLPRIHFLDRSLEVNFLNSLKDWIYLTKNSLFLILPSVKF